MLSNIAITNISFGWHGRQYTAMKKSVNNVIGGRLIARCNCETSAAELASGIFPAVAPTGRAMRHGMHFIRSPWERYLQPK
jgi:hypothetical protein